MTPTTGIAVAAAALALAACGGGRAGTSGTARVAEPPAPAAGAPPATIVTPVATAAPVTTAALPAPLVPTPVPEAAATPIGGRIATVPGQPSLGVHDRAVAPPATSPTARRLYAALDAAYAARRRFLQDGRTCLGVRTIDCFFKLNSLGGRVAVAGGVVGDIARTSTDGTRCGVATRAFANGEQLLRATVATWIQASNPEENDPPSEVRDEAAHAAAAYNLALLRVRAACGERPAPN